MDSQIDEVILYVTYRGAPQARFDRRYYVERHLPMVLDAWERHGLRSVAAFFPALEQAGTIAICECRFRDDAAIRAAFGSPATPAVMADVPNFTDLEPCRVKAIAL